MCVNVFAGEACLLALCSGIQSTIEYSQSTVYGLRTQSCHWPVLGMCLTWYLSDGNSNIIITHTTISDGTSIYENLS
jgi:hypothetical protein